MKKCCVSISDLNDEQLRIIKFPLEKNILVIGPASSGKTQLLFQRAVFLAKQHNISSECYRIFVSNEIQKDFLKSEVLRFALPDEVFTTLNDWCRLLYESYISKDLPRVYINLKIDYLRVRQSVLNLLQRRKELRNLLKIALVDDGQDLSPEAFEILSHSASHVTVFADFEQKVIASETSPEIILQKLKPECVKINISRSYRESPLIANLASYFISEEDASLESFPQSFFRTKGIECPVCYIAPSFEEEMNQLAETVSLRMLKGERVGIIVPSLSLVHEVSLQLKKRGVEVEKAIEREAQNVAHGGYNFTNSYPKITTYSISKGLKFQSVLLPQLTENSFSWAQNEMRKRALFIGLSRASSWVYLSTVKGLEFREIEILKRAKEKGFILLIDFF